MQRVTELMPSVLLAVAGIGKLFNLSQLSAVISAMGVFPLNWAVPLTYAIITLGLFTLGSFLLHLRTLSASVCVVLFSLFGGFHIWNLSQGIGVPCHCFGPLYTMPAWVSLILCMSMLGVSSLSVVKPRSLK